MIAYLLLIKPIPFLKEVVPQISFFLGLYPNKISEKAIQIKIYGVHIQI